jgi:hypothetical protein
LTHPTLLTRQDTIPQGTTDAFMDNTVLQG